MVMGVVAILVMVAVFGIVIVDYKSQLKWGGLGHVVESQSTIIIDSYEQH